ncbi:hypothetical protein CJ010_11140 [Azoarcus sp. DD4]|uniref:ricin-type beta-trefoil lectin domain protein n=1 Tax=Azoarcus sp. DD4 TaxID=2027405 RepID=UPI0011288E8B|nr:ricin-type beta-trefoil lectin domain protein [Azoarcus sp. DD4]QDF97040.1 hypothetical protein CJ010_11140 [Azoarcus sp. DD4]
MKHRALFLLPLLAASLVAPLAAQGQAPVRPGHLRLIDPLDRPADGYCLDIVGSGRHIRFDLPMTAHNCKPGLYADEAVTLEPNGYLRFPAYNACATIAGLDGRALPGAAVVPRECGERSPFMEADALQRFVHRADGRVELAGSGLCLTVGPQSASTFEASHRWRPLYVENCADTEPARSRWRFVVPAAASAG